MTEHFYYFLSFHHLFNITVYRTQRFLLCKEISAAQSGYFLRSKQHDGDHHQRYECQRYTQDDHADKDTDNRDHTG